MNPESSVQGSGGGKGRKGSNATKRPDAPAAVIEFWRKPTPFIDTRSHAFRKDGLGFISLCGDIFVANASPNGRKTMPRNGRCGRCVAGSSTTTKGSR
jgi:hypothetical protein